MHTATSSTDAELARHVHIYTFSIPSSCCVVLVLPIYVAACNFIVAHSTLSGDKIARQNRRCDITVTYHTKVPTWCLYSDILCYKFLVKISWIHIIDCTLVDAQSNIFTNISTVHWSSSVQFRTAPQDAAN